MTLRRISAAAVAVVSLAITMAGCSDLERQGCTSDEECRVKIGIGSVCTDDANAFCTVPTVHHACRSNSVPDNIWQTPELYGTTLAIGAIYDGHGHQLLDAVRVAVDVANIKGGDPTTRWSYAAIFCDLDAASWSPSVSYEDRAEEVADFLAGTVSARAIVTGVPTPATLRISQKVRQYGSIMVTANTPGPALLSELSSADKLVWTANVDARRLMRHFGNLAIKSHRFVHPDRWPEEEPAPALDVTIFTTPNLYTSTLASLLTEAVVEGGTMGDGVSPLSAVVEVVNCANAEACTEDEFTTSFLTTLGGPTPPDIAILYVESEGAVVNALRGLSSRADETARTGFLRDAVLLLPPVAYSAGAGWAAFDESFVYMARQIFGLHASADTLSEPYTEFDKASDILLDTSTEARAAEFSPQSYDAAWLSIVGIADAVKLAMSELPPAKAATISEAEILALISGRTIATRLQRYVSPGLANIDITGDYTTFNGFRNLIPSQWQTIFTDVMWAVPSFRFRAASGQAAVHPETHERISYDYSMWHIAAVGNIGNIPDYDNNVNVAAECMRGIRGPVLQGVSVFYCPVVHAICRVDPVPSNIDWLPDWAYLEPCEVSRDAWDGLVR